MLKKLFITAAAAAAVSVPLAGAAWANPAPTSPGSGGNTTTNPPVGKGGIPGELGARFDQFSAANPAKPPANPNGTGNPVPPGNTVSDLPHQGGTPNAVGPAINDLNKTYLGVTTNFGSIPPGLIVKVLTPGCASGTTAAGLSVCH